MVDSDFSPVVRDAFESSLYVLDQWSPVVPGSSMYGRFLLFLFPEMRSSCSEGCSVRRREGCILDLKQTVHLHIQPGLFRSSGSSNQRSRSSILIKEQIPFSEKKEEHKSMPSTG